jgi:endoglucanase
MISFMRIQNKDRVTFFLFLILLISSFLVPALARATVDPSPWWPTEGSHVTGTQPFKAELPGVSVSQYQMFWQVDGGGMNPMDSNYTDYPHKEASVNLSGWTWRGSGPYKVTFIAKQNDSTVSTKTINIYVDNATAPTPAPVVTQAIVTTNTVAAPVVAPTSSKVQTVTLAAPAPKLSTSQSSALYVDSNSNAEAQANTWRTSNPTGAAKMDILAAQSVASWFGNWNTDVYSAVHDLVSRAAAKGQTPVLVAYNIPGRDCGGYSAGGSNSPSGYKDWINSFAKGIGSSKAIVILEPDALAGITCLSQPDQNTRLSLISNAVSTLKANSGTKVYIDAAHSGWVDAATMATRLKQANIDRADGFALNVSNFDATDVSTNYGKQVSSGVGNKHFVIDTSRNGNGSNGEWCNPSGRALGEKPTLQTGNSQIDAYLWIKAPGESDGNCNGGPSAGVWWPDYALGLLTNAHY